MTWVWLAVGGGIGALLRARLADALRGREHGALVATAAVNLTGAFLLGLLVELTSGPVADVVGTGLLGALTTFSTWLVQGEAARPPRRRALVLAGQLAAGVALATLGLQVGAALSRS